MTYETESSSIFSMEDELDRVTKEADRIDEVYGTESTNRLVAYIVALRTKMEQAGAIRREGELRSKVETGEYDRW